MKMLPMWKSCQLSNANTQWKVQHWKLSTLEFGNIGNWQHFHIGNIVKDEMKMTN